MVNNANGEQTPGLYFIFFPHHWFGLGNSSSRTITLNRLQLTNASRPNGERLLTTDVFQRPIERTRAIWTQRLFSTPLRRRRISATHECLSYKGGRIAFEHTSFLS